MESESETWAVSVVNGYLVSSIGRLKRISDGYVVSQRIAGRGYKQANVRVDGHKFAVRVHRLVAEAFIPNPENKPHVNHKNGNKTDNRVENLEWATPAENARHAVATGLTPSRQGSGNGRARLTEADVIAARYRYERGETFASLASAYAVSKAAMWEAIRGATWRCVPKHTSEGGGLQRSCA